MQSQHSHRPVFHPKRNNSHMQYLAFESTLSEHHQLFSQYQTARTTGAAALARALATRYLPFNCYHLDPQSAVSEAERAMAH